VPDLLWDEVTDWFDPEMNERRLDAFCAFLRAIGRRLGKSVLMSPEGFDIVPVLGYDVDVDRVVVLSVA
jgi:hypothetical protein